MSQQLDDYLKEIGKTREQFFKEIQDYNEVNFIAHHYKQGRSMDDIRSQIDSMYAQKYELIHLDLVDKSVFPIVFIKGGAK